MSGKQGQRLLPTRITQLDALTLDTEIFNILKTQIYNTLQIIPPWALKQHELKLDILLHYVLWKLSICKFNGTFGQQLLNMKYHDGQMTVNKQKIFLMAQILSYLQNNDLLVSTSNKRIIAKTIDIVMHIMEVINLLVFFLDGKYPTVISRFLGLRLFCIIDKPRSVGYGYMTRELIWHGFLELLTFTMSVVNYQYIKRSSIRFLFKIRKNPAVMSTFNYTIETTCAVCFNPPVIPQRIGCSHVFCYYCLQTNRLADSNFECPSCGFFKLDIEYVQL